MREIKFRAWDGETMIYPDNKIFNGLRSYDILQRFDNVMQFTGLKDSEGKEIYEGDIVEWEDSLDNEMFGGNIIHPKEEVIFEGGAFYPVCTMPESEYEVIGNIYENPELLES